VDTKTTKTKPRLGRGLSSLISVSELPVQVNVAPPPTAPTELPNEPTPEPKSQNPSEIRVSDVAPNPHQPRKDFNQQALSDLAATIKSTGLIQPIVVRKQGDGYELIAGERRWRAAKLAGLETIPAVIREIDSFAQAQMALVENIQREDLNPLDRALAYRTLIGQMGLTQAELAARIGEDRSSVANFLRLLDLAEPVKTMIRDGRLSLGHAKILAGVVDVLDQQRLAELVLSQGLSVRNLERMIQQAPAAVPPSRNEPAASPHMQDLEKNLSRQLGMRVQLRASSKKGRGKLILHYSSLDQFDGLMQRLGVSTE